MHLTLISVSEPNIYPQSFRRFVHTANLVLPVLASLTPPGVNIKMIDEAVYVKRPDYQDLKTDLAALSVRTSCANRAYEISDRLRSRGIKTVLGGVHPTVLPEESKKHADAVVIGEAEPVWSEVIGDFRHNCLKSFYKGQAPPDLKNLLIPERKLLQFPNRALISFSTLQTSRGCPHNCSYCSVARVYGGKYRKRPVAEIIKELHMLKNSNHFYPKLFSACQDWLFFFLDDNLFSDKRYAKELLRNLQPLKKKWYSQAPISIAKDMELLELAKLAGCLIFAIGFESVVRDSLTQVNKKFNNPDFYYEAVERIHRAGIMVGASFVLGFDEDDTSVFEKTLRFAMQAGVDLASFHILTPYPGTPFYDQIVKENRLLVPVGSWQKFDTQHVVFRPKKMAPQELQQGFNWLWRQFTSLKSIRRRAKFTPHPLFFWPLNLFQNALFNASLVKLKSISQ